MINKVILIGHLGKDPELRTLESGSKLASFSLATNERYRDKNDQWQDATEWHNIIAWNFLAEKAERTLRKGSAVYIEGKITYRKFTDKENIERYVTEIVANSLQSLDKQEKTGNPLPSTDKKTLGGDDDVLPF